MIWIGIINGVSTEYFSIVNMIWIRIINEKIINIIKNIIKEG